MTTSADTCVARETGDSHRFAQRLSAGKVTHPAPEIGGCPRFPKRVMILGAGSTGRGHLGELAFEAGWDLVLVDKDADLVSRLSEAGRYTVDLYGPTSHRSVIVDRLRAYHVDDVAGVLSDCLDLPLILTSVFSHNLPQIAPLVARIIQARAASGVATPLNIVCCENMQDSSSMLRSLVMPLLGKTGDSHRFGPGGALGPDHFAEIGGCPRFPQVGFPDCMVSRVVPLATEDPLCLVAEDYNEWTVDATRFVGPPVDLPCMELVTNQAARLARKFFMHNGAHAVCGYFGFHRGHTYIHEAVADPVVLERVVGAIGELAPVVARRYGLDPESVREYGLELGGRGAVAQIRDLILRVVRDPLRKLSRQERLTAPALMALEYGLPCGNLVHSMAAVLHYYHEDDPQAVTMRARLAADGPAAVPEFLELPADHPLVHMVQQAYQEWEQP